MDGYTVEEAASVLGVPRERVWELIARGVLSAAPDLGGAMRVRLRADGPQTPQRAHDDVPPAETPPAPGGQSFGDPSPFRELLTEFRGLTERYGQALLALGEARGEVAGLRARVELLEARVDLRLAGGTSPPAEQWSAPLPPPAERVVPHDGERETSPPAEREADDGEADDERAAQRRRGRGGRRATDAFAEALARADDPSAPELPGARDAAAAWAALRDVPHAGEAGSDAALPRELPAADDVPVADEEPAPDASPERDAGTAVDAAPEEPPEQAPEEPREERAQQPPAQTPTEAARAAEDAAPETPQTEPPGIDRAPEIAQEPAVEATNGRSRHPEEAGAADDTRDAGGEADEAAYDGAGADEAADDAGEAAEVAESEAPASPAREAGEGQPAQPTPPAGEAQPEVQRVDDRYTTEIEEPGWFTAEELGLESASELAPAPDPAAQPEASIGWPRADAAPSGDVRARGAPAQESRSPQLDEGLAALDALAHPERTDPRAGERDAGLDRSSDAQTPAVDHGAEEQEAVQPSEPSDAQARVPPWSRPAPERASPGSIRAGSRAYRRLRRIFPD